MPSVPGSKRAGRGVPWPPMHRKRRALTTAASALALCGSLASPATGATLSWNVPGGTPSGSDYILVTSSTVTLELIAELGPDEPLSSGALVTAEAFPGIFLQFSGDPSQGALTSTVGDTEHPWFTGAAFCGAMDCTLVNQLNPSPGSPLPVDPFSGVIATVEVEVFEGTVWARGADFFGAEDVSVKLLLVPEPSAAGPGRPGPAAPRDRSTPRGVTRCAAARLESDQRGDRGPISPEVSSSYGDVPRRAQYVFTCIDISLAGGSLPIWRRPRPSSSRSG